MRAGGGERFIVSALALICGDQEKCAAYTPHCHTHIIDAVYFSGRCAWICPLVSSLGAFFPAQRISPFRALIDVHQLATFLCVCVCVCVCVLTFSAYKHSENKNMNSTTLH
jgi:hypothetical protein